MSYGNLQYKPDLTPPSHAPVSTPHITVPNDTTKPPKKDPNAPVPPKFAPKPKLYDLFSGSEYRWYPYKEGDHGIWFSGNRVNYGDHGETVTDPITGTVYKHAEHWQVPAGKVPKPSIHGATHKNGKWYDAGGKLIQHYLFYVNSYKPGGDRQYAAVNQYENNPDVKSYGN